MEDKVDKELEKDLDESVMTKSDVDKCSLKLKKDLEVY